MRFGRSLRLATTRRDWPVRSSEFTSKGRIFRPRTVSEALIQGRFGADATLEIYLQDDRLFYSPTGAGAESGVELTV